MAYPVSLGTFTGPANAHVVRFESPTRALVSQTKERFDAMLQHSQRAHTSVLVDTDGDTTVAEVCTARVEGQTHYVHTTYASASNVAEALSGEANTLVIVDEAHRFTSNRLGDLMALTPHKVLVSGTPRAIPLSLWSADDDRCFLMSMTEAEDAGVIVPQRFVLPNSAEVDSAAPEAKAQLVHRDVHDAAS
ncbi:hypothetical protein JKP88DRAFT_275296 [Tribonema minus]|uniref:Helicase ATP-binding domain-containing protein n=1 Tax=Tribonema minus TaxID=303371 RepID=A0A836CKZ5_9STRA|nr:hypothetical protein JKP88DRAFT_275296 [Tribonema minus]